MSINIERRSIFKKSDAKPTESRETCTILNAKDIENSLPPDLTKDPLGAVPDNHVEWRWRFFKIGNKKLVEISYLDGDTRIFKDYNGNSIEYDLQKEWDEYLVKTLYAYVKK